MLTNLPSATETDIPTPDLLPGVVEVLPCPVAAVDALGVIRATNAAWNRMLGQPGRTLPDLFPAVAHKITVAGSVKAVPLARRAATAASWWDLDVVTHPALLGIVLVTAHDVTYQLVADKEPPADSTPLAWASRLRRLIESMPASLAMLDTDMRLLAVSPRFVAGHGLVPAVPERSNGRSLLDILPAFGETWTAIRRLAQSGQADRGEIGPYARPDGSRESIRWSVMPWHNADATVGGTILATEVTIAAGLTDPSAAEPLADTGRRQDVQSALMQSQKLETLGQLTAGVAHDFNNVLAAIQGSFEIIARHTGEPRVERIVALGMNATQRAILLTRQLLDFGRNHSLEPAVLDTEVSIRQANELIGYAVGPRIGRSLYIQPGVWPVLADENQLEVALLNLAINAKDAMPDGGKLVLEARNVAPRERPEASPFTDFVRISVSDSGHGMPPDVAARAIEPFFTTKPEGRGTGLGLPMVHAFALRSGGRLTIDSREGIGTTVSIILPRAAISGMETQETQPDSAAGVGTGAATVLLVEADPGIRQITAGYLARQGYNVVDAPDAEAAIARSRSIGQPGILVTEVALPGTNGLALAEQLGREWPGLPVVFMTGLIDRNDLAGEHVLLKPFTGAELALAVARRLNRDADQETADGGLLRRLTNPALLAAYLFWRAERRGGKPPRMIDIDWGALPNRENVFTAAVEVDGDEVRFRYMHVGRSLVARSGQAMGGTGFATSATNVDDDAVLGSLANVYARSARTFAPSYDYARYDFGDGEPVLFERLILPMSDDGERVTHLIGMVLFAGDV